MNKKPVKTVGVFNTRNFEFVVCGDSRYHCCQLLKEAWKEHRKVYNADPRNYLDDLIDQSWEELQWEFSNWFEDIHSGDMFIEGDKINE